MIPGVWPTDDRKSALDLVENWLAAIRTGSRPCRETPASAVFSGPPGTGKSFLGSAIAGLLAGGSTPCEHCAGAGVLTRPNPLGVGFALVASPCYCARRLRARSVSVLTPLGAEARPGLFDLFGDEAGFDYSRRSDARAALNYLADAAFLVVDEFGGEREAGTTYLPGLLRLLDARSSRFTLYLTNLTSTEIAAKYEARIVSRILGAGVSLFTRYGSTDYRNNSPPEATK